MPDIPICKKTTSRVLTQYIKPRGVDGTKRHPFSEIRDRLLSRLRAETAHRPTRGADSRDRGRPYHPVLILKIVRRGAGFGIALSWRLGIVYGPHHWARGKPLDAQWSNFLEMSRSLGSSNLRPLVADEMNCGA
jgi:hypothetical protein